ncbi:hypothetical protein HD806DRAFT_323746 [Xylariaceae sp. AK1471]|nr:hypothetical protein HD806DRAFT_323746 [Xylariaceae sp. AK1471]
MAAPYDRKGRPGGRDWRKSRIGRILHRFPRYRGTRKSFKFQRCTRRSPTGSKDRPRTPIPEESREDSCEVALVLDTATEMDRDRDQVELELDLTSGEPSIQTRATTPLDDNIFSPAESESEPESNLGLADKPQETELARARPFSRTHSRTFPQSNREKKEADPVFPLSIDAILGKSDKAGNEVETENVAHNEGIRWRPVPKDFQSIDSFKQEKLYKKVAFETQMKALKLAIRQEQTGKRIQDSKRFVAVWESKLLPKLEQVLDDNVQGEYTVSVTRSTEPGQRTITIMTAMSMSENVERQIQESKSGILPSDLDLTTTVMFREGRVEFLTDSGASLSRVSSCSSDDSCTGPLNIDWHPDPAIGDSVGWESESASLGPMLQIDQGFYRLVCWHLFDDKGTNRRCDTAQPPQGLSTYHPSDNDRDHGSGRNQTYIGDVAVYSGPMYRTSRLSVSVGPHLQTSIVTDWALIDSAEARENIPQLNRVRRKMPHSPFICEIEVTQVKDPKSFRRACDNELLAPLVYSVGRTSGYTTGQLSEVPSLCKLGNGFKRKEWTIENEYPENKKAAEEWIRGGMGVPGDSGAGVFGCYKNELLGQVWGRNTYYKSNPEPRVTYFTSMSDIYADIREKMPGCASIQLPTRASITDSAQLERNPAVSDVTWRADPHPGLSAIREELNNVDLDDWDDQELRHRSAATSRRLGALDALRKNVSFIDAPGCQPFQRWAKAIIHAATF